MLKVLFGHVCPDPTGGDTSSVEAGSRLDPQSREWIDGLRAAGPRRDETLARLHGLLLRVARSEVGRRTTSLRLAGPELDDIAHQAAADALMAIDAKVQRFRGESRFTTWAYKFVIFEVSTKIGRHFWRTTGVPLDQEDWDRLPDRAGVQPHERAEWSDLVAAIRRAVAGPSAALVTNSRRAAQLVDSHRSHTLRLGGVRCGRPDRYQRSAVPSDGCVNGWRWCGSPDISASCSRMPECRHAWRPSSGNETDRIGDVSRRVRTTPVSARPVVSEFGAEVEAGLNVAQLVVALVGFPRFPDGNGLSTVVG
jgi:DNA-directed RNA polymerase specialized sigma24 family protein